MAAVTATDRSHHATLSAGTADTVTFPFEYRWVTVKNRATTGVLYVRTDGTAAVVAADGTIAVPAGQSVVVRNGTRKWDYAENGGTSFSSYTPLVVSIISATADPYDLEC